MSMIRIPEPITGKVHSHLFSKPGEHFAFMRARWTYSGGEPVFMVHDVILVPDEQIKLDSGGWELTTEGIITVINQAVRAGDALIEAHNHGGSMPRFSPTDELGLQEFPLYVLDSLPNRPYGATVWGDSTVYGEYFLPDGQRDIIRSIISIGTQLSQIISRNDDRKAIEPAFDRQLPWFTSEGQRRLGRIKMAVAGAGGSGSPLLQNLVYLGGRDFVVIDFDESDETNMNRLVTATAADIETPKTILARRLIKSVAPAAKVKIINVRVESAESLDALKGVDIIFGCFDNDGPRLILNEMALAYGIPYFDLAVGINANKGLVTEAGGRLAIILPGCPCLQCMQLIDVAEANFYLSTKKQQEFQLARGYIRGMNVKAPSVVSLNAAIAAAATNEFAMYLSGLRPVNLHTELDLFGVGRPIKSQWLSPVRVAVDPGCVQCANAGIGDASGIDRYSTFRDSTVESNYPVQ